MISTLEAISTSDEICLLQFRFCISLRTPATSVKACCTDNTSVNANKHENLLFLGLVWPCATTTQHHSLIQNTHNNFLSAQ